MTATAAYPNAPDLNAEDYILIGLATCFLKQEGEVTQVTMAEPIPSAYLEALMKGVPTSYQSLYAVSLGEVLEAGQPKLLPAAKAANAQVSPDFVEQALAAARTYQSRPEAQTFVPAGTVYTDVNYSTERKRILNAENMVTADDNVKQHQYTHMTL
ncbi:hypothetical protein IQ241_18730 [Romeria aff. gracilis LEGE 07310]|uniref:Uncharacterized protein n=1 Tax=Vasconcelosia minhoensis LEGE 07310 TaxID=915328 RepID=A0A8J7ARN8_9CYAN|nr:hypothetical protein [Romeria gracilis]MBE9079306.1 hypothetical protein [Romeria aff. gracilis LEGE 07310]